MEEIDQVDAVERMQNYISDHIQEPITLHQLAVAAGYSPWYASRIFKVYVGKSPLEYSRLLKVSKAALQLRDSNQLVLDIALDFSFNSHEGFTRAFSDSFGISPKRYQKQKPPIPLFLPYSVASYYYYKKKGDVGMAEKKEVQPVFVQVVTRPDRRLILKRGIKADNYFDYCKEVGCDVWGVLVSMKEALYEPIGLWLPENLRPKGTSEYAQGVEVPFDWKGTLPEGFEIIDLAACQVMVFQGPEFKDEDFEEAIIDLWALMKNYNPDRFGFKWADELGPRFQLEPLGERGYIEARPVVAL